MSILDAFHGVFSPKQEYVLRRVEQQLRLCRPVPIDWLAGVFTPAQTMVIQRVASGGGSSAINAFAGAFDAMQQFVLRRLQQERTCGAPPPTPIPNMFAGGISLYDPGAIWPSSELFMMVNPTVPSQRWQDGGGTVPCEANGDPLVRLDDASGNVCRLQAQAPGGPHAGTLDLTSDVATLALPGLTSIYLTAQLIPWGSAFTISFFFRGGAQAVGGNAIFYIDLGAPGVELQQDGTSNDLRLTIAGAGGSSVKVTTGVNFFDNTPRVITVVCDGTNAGIAIYANGVAVAIGSNPSANDPGVVPTNTLIVGAAGGGVQELTGNWGATGIWLLALDDTDREMAECFLASQHDLLLTLPLR